MFSSAVALSSNETIFHASQINERIDVAGDETRDIKVEIADVSLEDLTPLVESTPLCASIGQFADTNVPVKQEDLEMYVEEEEEGSAQVDLGFSASFKDEEDVCCDIALPKTGPNQRTVELGGIESSSLETVVSFPLDSKVSISSVVLKEENWVTRVEGKEEGSAQVDSDACVSFEDKGDTCYDNKVFPKTGINQRADELGEIGSSSQKAAASCYLDSEVGITNVLLKERNLGTRVEEEEKKSTQSDLDSAISFENKGDSCCGDEVFPKTEMNQRANESGEIESSQESAASFSLDSEASVASVFLKEGNSGIQAKEEVLNSTQVDLNSGSSLEDKEDGCLGDKVLLEAQTNQRAEESDKIESSAQKAIVSSAVNSELSTEQYKSGILLSIPSVPCYKKPFQCSTCPAVFGRKVHLKQHEVCHSSERPFSCTQCSSTFKRSNELKRHLKVVHSDERPLSCAQCSSRFKNKVALRAHVLIHSDEKPFACPECAATFQAKNMLKKHSVVHSKNRPFSCSHCSARFVSKTRLRIHLIAHSEERPFPCPHCPSKFKSKYGLNTHLVTHSIERPFQCSECSASFRDRGTRRRHTLLVHSSERPFACSHCPARFAFNAHLKQHLAVHSNEKPFSCPYCSSTFKLVWNLTRHLQNPCRDPLALDPLD